MEGRNGIPLVLLAGVLLFAGITWGAISQKETFLGNEESEAGEATSDLTILTGFLVGAGAALALFALGDAPVRRRAIAASVGGVASWFLTWLVQSALPNYFVLPDFGQADVLQSNLLVDGSGAASVLLPIIALGILLMLGIGWSIRQVQSAPEDSAPIDGIRRDHLGIAALAVPALLLTAGGMLRVMLHYPSNMQGAGLVVLLHPIAMAGCVALAVSVLLRSHWVANLQKQPDKAWPILEAWRTMDRIDVAAIASLALVAVISTFLPSEPLDITSVGPTLVLTPSSHGQAVIFLAAVLVPLHMLHRRIGSMLPTARTDLEASDAPVRRDAWIFLGVVAAASALGFILALSMDRALVPWAVALVPAGVMARIVGRPRSSALVRIVGAWAMWGIGNSIVAFYSANTFPDLEFLVHPGILALWRMGAAALMGWVVADVLRDAAWDQPMWVAVPLSVAAGVGVALVMLLELSLNVWADNLIGGHKVAVGSLVVSQLGGVRVVMHFLAFVSVLGAVMATTRLLRPHWFRRRRGAAVQDAPANVTPG